MRKRLLLLLLVLSFGKFATWAQQTTGQINGALADTTGAVVVGATVTATNVDTGLVRSTQSSSSGNYALTFLPPGMYDVKTDAKGFASVLQKHVELPLGRAVTLNLTLKPGATTEIVEVTGEAPLIETTRSEIGGSVNPMEVRELPILDRNFASLALMVPGVRPAQGFDPTKTAVGNMSVNGGDGRQFDINVDGGDDKDNVVGGLIQNFTVEGIQEFNVVTNRYSAESGRTVGGVVNVITKSGTNSLHGSAFGELQNDNLNRLDFFRAQSCVAQGIADCKNNEFKRFHFGGSVGGPIIKDKAFFFGAYEHKRQPQSLTVNPDAFDQLSLFPLAEPVASLPAPFKDHLLTVKLDLRASDRQSWFLRYGRERWEFPNDQLGNPFTADLTQTQTNLNNFHDLSIQNNWTISNTKVNSLTLHFQDMANTIAPTPQRTFTLPTVGGGTTTNPRIFFTTNLTAEIGQNVNVPQQTFIRKYQFRDDLGWTAGRHNIKLGANYIFVSKLGGSFFFGANGHDIGFWDDPSVILANPAMYPQGFATPGAVETLNFSGGDGNFNQRPHMLGLYFQDDFRVTPRLTLNLGLRWDLDINLLPPQLGDSPTNSNRTINLLRQIVAANPTAPGAADGLARAQQIAGDESKLRRTTPNWKEFQPRVGFAWDPTGAGRMVIRGGYGIAFDQIFQNLTLFALQQSNPTLYQTLIGLQNDDRPGLCDPANPLCSFRFGIDPLPVGTPLSDLEVGGFGRINDPDMRSPYAQQASIGWQWQFHPDFSISADYYHVQGTAEPRVLNINPQIRQVCSSAFPGSNPADPRCVAGASTRFFDAAFQAIGLGAGRLTQSNMIATNNRSRFDSINVELKKRLSHRFTFRTSYVLSWSKSWGGRPTSSYSGNGVALTPEIQFRDNEFGYTTLDERHRFVVSGIFQLPGGVEITPIFQASSARPLDGAARVPGFLAGTDLDGDGRSTADRVCVGSTASVAGAIRNPGCEQLGLATLRGNPFVQLDLRATKVFKFGERADLRLFWEVFNLFDRDNFCNNLGNNVASPSTFLDPQGYCGGQGFGAAFSGPMRSQIGLRFQF